MKRFILALACLMPVVGLAQSEPKIARDIDGVYEGFIKMNTGEAVPLVLSLKQTEVEDPTLTLEHNFAFKKRMVGSIVIDQEAGPFALAQFDYDLNIGRVTLQYSRPGTTGQLSSVVNLRLEGVRSGDGVIKGNVTSGISGNIGTFELTQKTNVSVNLQPVPKYVGHWVGQITYNKITTERMRQVLGSQYGSVRDFAFVLSAGDGYSANPDDIEIASTPKKLGSATIDNSVLLDLPFNSVEIDYLRRKIKMTYTDSQTGMSVFYEGIFDESGKTIKGKISSTRHGQMGTFTVRKNDE